MAQNNQLRKEAYRFYRSLGYSSKEATNLRNKSPKRLTQEFKKARKKFTDKRVAYYRGDRKTRPTKKPYKPKILTTGEQRTEYVAAFEFDFGVPQDIADQIIASDSILEIELYRERIEGLRYHFANEGKTWDEILDQIGDYEDIGEWLDKLGELYDEDEIGGVETPDLPDKAIIKCPSKICGYRADERQFFNHRSRKYKYKCPKCGKYFYEKTRI